MPVVKALRGTLHVPVVKTLRGTLHVPVVKTLGGTLHVPVVKTLGPLGRVRRRDAPVSKLTLHLRRSSIIIFIARPLGTPRDRLAVSESVGPWQRSSASVVAGPSTN